MSVYAETIMPRYVNAEVGVYDYVQKQLYMHICRSQYKWVCQIADSNWLGPVVWQHALQKIKNIVECTCKCIYLSFGKI